MQKHDWNQTGIWLWFAASLALLPCLLLPIYNPDLFWHLSAADRMVALRVIPSYDWMTATGKGVPWVDFEWAAQLLYWDVFRIAGLAGLWVLKILLLGVQAAVFLATLKLYRIHRVYGAAGLAFWAAALFSHSDIRPEQFSILAFGFLFLILESRRLGGPHHVRAFWMTPFFSLWSNLHAGFPYGLLLLLFYGIGETPALQGVLHEDTNESENDESLWRFLAFGLVGTLLQPFHLKAYGVLYRHWRDMSSLAARITEWGAAGIGNPWHWPYWVVLSGAFAAALLHFLRKGRISFAPALTLLFFGVSGLVHVRHGAFFVVVAIPLAFHFASGDFLPDPDSVMARSAALGVIGVCAAYSFWWGSHFGLLKTTFHPRFVPVGAGEFLAREKAALGGRPVYNKSGWGGYLGWRLFPDYRAFQDGRYIFTELLNEEARATASPGTWQSFLDRYGIQVAVMENARSLIPSTRRYPDQPPKTFFRPYYVSYMPRERWALVYWDPQAIIFVRRSDAPPQWLATHEFRYARPFDDSALNDAVRRHEVPIAQLDAEIHRHRRDIRLSVAP